MREGKEEKIKEGMEEKWEIRRGREDKEGYRRERA